MMGLVEFLNIGPVREVEHNGRTVSTGIYKSPTSATQRIANNNVGLDRQADLKVHGGPHKAVYVYSSEDYRWWEDKLARSLEPGIFGENITTSGIDVTNANVGDRWQVGTATLEVSEPRLPCFKLGVRMGMPRIQKTFANANRPGAYLRVLDEGDVTAGDVINVQPVSPATVTMAEIARIYHDDRDAADSLLDVEGLSDAWRSWAQGILDRRN